MTAAIYLGLLTLTAFIVSTVIGCAVGAIIYRARRPTYIKRTVDGRAVWVRR